VFRDSVILILEQFWASDPTESLNHDIIPREPPSSTERLYGMVLALKPQAGFSS
jgi:hypothetical protein